MIHPMIAPLIESVCVRKTAFDKKPPDQRPSVSGVPKSEKLKKAEHQEPCGHAAHVDSVESPAATSTESTIAWTGGTCPHAHKAGDFFSYSVKGRKQQKVWYSERTFQ